MIDSKEQALIKHKSGQAALIIVIVTMVTALGVAVSSVTQSNLNLKETVYSTQSTQAKACAEAGAERALASLINDPPLTLVGGVVTQSSADPNSSIDGCTYTTTIKYYPCSAASYPADPLCNDRVYIASLAENAVQQINVNSGSGKRIDIEFTNGNIPEASLAVYLYKASSVERKMYHCGSSNSPSNDFIDLTVNSGKCTISDLSTNDVNLVRLRPLYTNMSITVSDTGVEGKQSGYLIKSKGSAGSVTRSVSIFRYYSQLPSAFDEALVSLGSGELN